MVKGPRRLSFLDVFCLGLNAIVGSGIFLFPGLLAARAGPASALAFLACAGLLCTIALCYAELGAMFQENGAAYVYAREAFGEPVGYSVGFVAWATAVLSGAAVASVLTSQLGLFHPALGSDTVKKAAASAGIALFGLLNYRGIKPAAWAVDVLTVAKLIPLMIFVLCGLAFVDFGRYTPYYGGRMDFGYAMFLALWPLQGFEVAPIPAGETDDPQRDLPRAIVGSLLFAAVIYAAVQTVAVGAFPGLSSSTERPLVDAAQSFMGPWGGTLMAGAGVVSMLGFVAGESLGAPRFLSALSARALRPLRLAEAHPAYGTPHRAVLTTTGTTMLLIALLDFRRLIDLSNLAVVTQYLACCLSLCVLRVRRPSAPRPYRVPFAWLVGPAGCLISLWLMSRVRLEELGGVGLVLAAGFAMRLMFNGSGAAGRAAADA